MDKKALKDGAIMAALILVVFEVIVIIAGLINPEGLIFQLDFRDPVDQLVIIGGALVCGVSMYVKEAAKNKQNAMLDLEKNKGKDAADVEITDD